MQAKKKSVVSREERQAHQFSAMFRIFSQNKTDYEVSLATATTSLYQSHILQELDGNNSSSTSEKNKDTSTSPDGENRIDAIASDETWQSASESRGVGMIVVREQSQFFNEERKNAFICFLLLCVAFVLSTVSLALTHDRLPNRKIYKPLPDVFLDNVKSLDFLLNVTEIQILVSVNFCIALMFFHKYR